MSLQTLYLARFVWSGGQLNGFVSLFGLQVAETESVAIVGCVPSLLGHLKSLKDLASFCQIHHWHRAASKAVQHKIS
jgi:hypothetical protein